MIYFRFSIDWPWSKHLGGQKDYYNRTWKVSENKSFEIQFTKWGSMNELFEVVIDTGWIGSDHAGLKFQLTIGPLFLSLDLYDNRHWNYDTNAWYTDEEAKAEMEEWEAERK
jgi:hypothetical protein